MLKIFRLFAVLTLAVLCGCAGARGVRKGGGGAGAPSGNGVYHTVGKGETLWRICRNYGVSLREVTEANHLKDPRDIAAGKRLIIPGAKKQAGPDVAKYRAARKVVPVSVERDNGSGMAITREKFLWPVDGQVSSGFGTRNGVRHDGIDIRATEGTPVRAASDGNVVFVSATMRGYGNIIIVKHYGNFYTVYAHNKQNLVAAGDKVAKGETIATVGTTGNASGSHLHFEVRHGKSTINPLFYLP